MKKFKLFNILLILVMFFMIPTVYAHNIEVDTNDVIKIPLDSKDQIASTTKIVVNESYGEYNLYYQYVKMDKDVLEQYLSIENEQLEYEAENRPNDNASNAEIIAYNNEMAQYEASKQALKPGYVEADWILSDDGTVPFQVKEGVEVEDKDAFVLWIKVTKKTEDKNPVYDEKLIIHNVVEEDVQSPSTSDNILVIGILAVAVIGLMTVSYKKSRA